MDNTTLCDEIIEFFNKETTVKRPGMCYGEGSAEVNKFKKDSMDTTIPEGPLLDEYYWHLDQCFVEYSKIYPFVLYNDMVKVINRPNIQWYPPGGGFKIWHCERGRGDEPIVSRFLVFMTYLNDVPDGGTEFYHQRTRIKAEKGLTVIWPVDYTHVHRSQVSNTSEKYVVTGWFNYMPTPEGFERSFPPIPNIDW